jgi:hypothetical protein
MGCFTHDLYIPAVIPAGFLGINRSSVFCSGSFSHLKVEQSRRVPKADDIELQIYSFKGFFV